eukprot:TRINITY_DN8361_c0_g1_i1.p1 TRINITY_DN8361_c0_g1~~TRINITY_DN8361_c0_g1_i1.p1  ORF type:complete len:377 (-),score=134.27 TRINITY_DN8361_c0_g1_i1:27-1157(-)
MTTAKVDYYVFMGVAKDATENDIKKAYYKMALQLHPDKNPGDQESLSKFQQLQKIYSVLSNSQRRKDYDRFGEDDEDENDEGENEVSEGEEEEYSYPSYEELTKLFSGITKEDYDHAKLGLEHKETMNKNTKWTANIVKEEIERAKEAKIHHLDFSGKKITSIPKEIGELNWMTRLDLSRNNLKSLPVEIYSLVELRELNLSGNQLTSLPEELGNLTKLKTLNLEHNQITSLPESIGKLEKLSSLNAFANQLKSVPESLVDLKCLVKLDLECNFIDEIPEQLTNNSSLKLKVDESLQKGAASQKSQSLFSDSFLSRLEKQYGGEKGKKSKSAGKRKSKQEVEEEEDDEEVKIPPTKKSRKPARPTTKSTSTKGKRN